MTRIMLVHWKPEEAEPRLDALRKAGFDPSLAPHAGKPEWKRAFDPLPAAIVIDLDRLPSQGRAVAHLLRRQKSTRSVPLVFAGGLPEKVATAREVIPDAAFTAWTQIGVAVRKAIQTGTSPYPVIPAHLGNPKRSLAQRLGIRDGAVVMLLGAPDRFDRKLEPLPEGVRLQSGGRGEPASVLLAFAPTSLELARRFDPALRLLAPGGKFWIAWPKRASGVETDLTMPFIREFALEAGWVDYKVCAFDETWSGMLLGKKK